MASGDIKSVFGAKTTITCTLTSLANTTGGRESTVIDNTANLFLDALVRILTKGQASGVNLLDVYVYFSLADATYTDGATGADAAFTVANRLNVKYLGSVKMNAAVAVQAGPFSIAQACGGILPSKWGLIFVNNSGAALSAVAGDHVIEYQGVYANVAP